MLKPGDEYFDDWVKQAACRRLPEKVQAVMFHAEPYSPQEDAALAVCSGCPVEGDCLEAVMADELLRAGDERPVYRDGVWGGLTARGRHDLFEEREAFTGLEELTFD